MAGNGQLTPHDERPTSMHWYIGTMGFSYGDWVGPFYPKGTKASDYLAYYGRHFNALELDTTFYAVPDVGRVTKWAAAVPEGFKFCVKTPQGITHHSTIAGAVRPMVEFVDVVRNFGEKLGVVLIQFPPSLGASEFGKLETFLNGLPTDVRYAVEFRNASWRNGRTAQLLRSHKVAWVAQDYAGQPAELPVTADFAYVRLIGEHDRFQELNREQVDPTEALEWWKGKIEAAGVGTVFAMFNNEYAGFSVATANRFKRMLGLAVNEGPLPPDQRQMTLF